MSNMKTIGSKTRMCAFCKHWYDPAGACIRPKSPNFWEYDPDAKNKCLIIGVTKPSWTSCNKFESKL